MMNAISKKSRKQPRMKMMTETVIRKPISPAGQGQHQFLDPAVTRNTIRRLQGEGRGRRSG